MFLIPPLYKKFSKHDVILLFIERDSNNLNLYYKGVDAKD